MKSKLASIKFLNFTSDSAEYLALLSGSLDYGYVPFADAPGDSRVKALGYSIDPWSQGGLNYADYTIEPGRRLDVQAVLRPRSDSVIGRPAGLYQGCPGRLRRSDLWAGTRVHSPRQVVQRRPLRVTPPSRRTTIPLQRFEGVKSLLSANGWKVVPGGVDTCVKPGTAKGDCGTGVTKGQKLSFQILYPSGVIQYGVELQALARVRPPRLAYRSRCTRTVTVRSSLSPRCCARRGRRAHGRSAIPSWVAGSTVCHSTTRFLRWIFLGAAVSTSAGTARRRRMR